MLDEDRTHRKEMRSEYLVWTYKMDVTEPIVSREGVKKNNKQTMYCEYHVKMR